MYQRLIPKKMPTNVNIDELAAEFDGVSGSDISNAILMAAFAAARANEMEVKHEYFRTALTEIKKSQAANKGSVEIKSVPVSEETVKSELGYIPS